MEGIWGGSAGWERKRGSVSGRSERPEAEQGSVGGRGGSVACAGPGSVGALPDSECRDLYFHHSGLGVTDGVRETDVVPFELVRAEAHPQLLNYGRDWGSWCGCAAGSGPGSGRRSGQRAGAGLGGSRGAGRGRDWAGVRAKRCREAGCGGRRPNSRSAPSRPLVAAPLDSTGEGSRLCTASGGMSG